MSENPAVQADLLRPFQLERSRLRGRVVRLAQTVDYVLRAHDYPPAVSGLLGELLVLAGGLAGGLKFDGSFSLQVRGDGAVRLMVADCTNDGKMRGYASFDADAVGEAGADPGRLLGRGLMALTVDQAASGGDVYQGVVQLDGRSLADSMLTYFHQSEQVPTGIRTALGRDTLTGAWRAGAVIVQAAPGTGPAAGPEAEDDWRRTMLLLQTASETELLGEGVSADELLWRLFHEEGVRVFDPLPLQPSCSCDRERVENVLRSFSPEDFESMRLPDGSVTVTCQFCSRLYRFGPEEVAGLLHGHLH